MISIEIIFQGISSSDLEVDTRSISLLTTNVICRELIGINRTVMEEALKSFSIGGKVLARRLNATWNILLACTVLRFFLNLKSV